MPRPHSQLQLAMEKPHGHSVSLIFRVEKKKKKGLCGRLVPFMWISRFTGVARSYSTSEVLGSGLPRECLSPSILASLYK